MIERSKDIRSVRSRKEIKRAFLELLKTKDYESISVTQIVKESGYSSTAFYNNFLDKEDCLKNIIDEQAQIYIDRYNNRSDSLYPLNDEWIVSEGNPYELLFREPYEVVYENKEFYNVLFTKLEQKWADYFIRKIMNLLMTNKSYLAKGRNADMVDTKLWIYSHVWDTLGRVEFWIKSGFIYSPEYMGRQQYLKRIDGTHIFKNKK